MMSPVVEFCSVNKCFGSKLLVDNVSFKLNPREITTLIGQNGAGKTTIAKMILGLEKSTQGQIKVKDNLKIGYAPQKLDFNFNMPLNAGSLIDILAPGRIGKEVSELINFADFDNIRKVDISELSGGQLQKLVLAGTLMNQPDLVILDEPTQYLDVTSQQEFYKLLKQIKETTGLTVFLISHDLFTVMKNSDQVICINGHVCCIGKPNEASNNLDFKNALSEIGFYVHSHDHVHNH
ncbi:MAG: metal ABC transporter ATP-binding protein [Rickettsiales bacterium]|nr:metal ABC transporter ATP-binding protein [Rickettsiales bacterium]